MGSLLPLMPSANAQSSRIKNPKTGLYIIYDDDPLYIDYTNAKNEWDKCETEKNLQKKKEQELNALYTKDSNFRSLSLYMQAADEVCEFYNAQRFKTFQEVVFNRSSHNLNEWIRDNTTHLKNIREILDAVDAYNKMLQNFNTLNDALLKKQPVGDEIPNQQIFWAKHNETLKKLDLFMDLRNFDDEKKKSTIRAWTTLAYEIETTPEIQETQQAEKNALSWKQYNASIALTRAREAFDIAQDYTMFGAQFGRTGETKVYTPPEDRVTPRYPPSV